MRARPLAVLSMAWLVTACAGTSADPLVPRAMNPDAIFFVMNHGRDERHLEVLIAGVLRRRGLDARHGDASALPPDATFVVDYRDHWAWDMRTYLAEIDIVVREIETGEVVGASRSHQDSLSSMGFTYQEIVRRTAGDLFPDAEDTPGRPAAETTREGAAPSR